MVRLLVPEPLTPAPVALSKPLVSVSVAVKVSPPVLPLSATEMPGTAVAEACATETEPGAVIAGALFVVMAIFCGVALLPRLSVAVMWIVSDPLVASSSCSVARSGVHLGQAARYREGVGAGAAHPGAGGYQGAGRVGQRDREGLGRHGAGLLTG